MNRHLPANQPPERRLSKSQREASRLLDGFGSNKTKPIESLGKQNLLDLRDKTQTMLNNSTITATLPDKGSKLKEKLALIETLLNSSANDTPESVSDKVSKLSLENNNRPNIRKKSVADANLEACRIHLSSNLLQAHGPVGGSGGIGSMIEATEMDDRQKAKVRMISLEESVRLQDHQRDRIKEEGFRKQLRNLKPRNVNALDDDISMTMNRLRLDPGIRVPRPADDNTDDDEGPDEDGNDDDDDDDEDDDDYNYDSAYDEDDSSIHDEGLVQDDYYGRR
ncbi:unnamed protein product [Absidia cylindrospora]